MMTEHFKCPNSTSWIEKKKKQTSTKTGPWYMVENCYISTASKEVEVYIFFGMIKLDIKRESDHR